jgi:hypothetical protein
MLTNDEQKFITWWQQNREREKSLSRQLRMVLPIGFLIGAGIILNFVTGWYSRANMVANSQSTPMILLIAIVIIAIFCSIFYKRHRWEMNEQRYLELQAREKRNKNSAEMQHEQVINGQGN